MSDVTFLDVAVHMVFYVALEINIIQDVDLGFLKGTGYTR